MPDDGTPIENSTAVTYPEGQFVTVCDLSGFRIRSGGVTQWNGLYVDKRFADKRNPQDFVRSRGDDGRWTSLNPRGTDSYIEDIYLLGDDLDNILGDDLGRYMASMIGVAVTADSL